ncbi:SMP-30/gluconolactonase/LRE family protein [Solimonas sp. K1W22B-7]|uniref:SMP-30/gluconolactonase/LRE family protein n=1 Tax=Solimonas sp. K1W22B-7 TaxID=2303331 RepID=UPI000E32E796|nr:SMP-30/gluconolactonase/LRE family protein [Solimonas sp. K1W22B-7]AXQ30262.1 SMP-30/gluconolactonase/LRE family protein [Solimonas sp. K1W22B-7]
MKKLLLVAFVLLALVAWAALAPSPINPQAWRPAKAPALEGVYARNDILRGIQKLALGAGNGPEGVALDREGRVYAGYLDGRIVRLDPGTGKLEELGNTGGRPLGIAIGPAGELYAADADQGLVQIENGQMKVLSTSAGGKAFRFVDDVEVSADGNSLYFSDASARFGIHDLMKDVLEHGGTGRVLRYDRSTGETTVLKDGLYFPNGVALGPNEDYLLFDETARYQVSRLWLKGEKAGTVEVLIDNLPGFPDNLSFNGSDRIWVAIYAPRSPDLDRLLPYPGLRRIVERLPEWTQPKPKMQSFALALDLDGKVVQNLQYDGPGAYAPITSVEQRGEWLYFGSLSHPAFGRMKTP